MQLQNLINVANPNYYVAIYEGSAGKRGHRFDHNTSEMVPATTPLTPDDIIKIKDLKLKYYYRRYLMHRPLKDWNTMKLYKNPLFAESGINRVLIIVVSETQQKNTLIKKKEE